MTSRFVPYATTPGRLLAQLISDYRRRALDHRVGAGRNGRALRDLDHRRGGQSGRDRRQRVAGNLDSAGDRADNFPLVGDALSNAAACGQRGGAPTSPAPATAWTTTAIWLAWVLALAVAAPPILCVAMPWLFLRMRFFRRKWTGADAGRTPAGEQLLALRALANRPLAKLAAIHADPVGAWRREDPMAIRGLAALELRAAGVARASRR